MSDKPIKVLLVEDDKDYVPLVRHMLAKVRDVKFEIEVAGCLKSGMEHITEEGIDVILLDLNLPDSQGLDTLSKMHTQVPEVPILVLSGLSAESLGVKEVQSGAQDILYKRNMNSDFLTRSICYAIERQRLRMDLRRKTRELQASETRLRTIIENNADSIIIVDRPGIVRFVNPAAETLFNRKANEFLGEMFGFPVVASETTELDIIRPGGEKAVAEMRVVESVWEGEPAYLASLRDITERMQMIAQLEKARRLERHLAYHDALTGLPNRILFHDRLQQAVAQARRSGSQVGLLFMDLDGFKRINDTLGHNIGDLLLQAVVERLQATVRATDTVARLGGDEFTVVLNELRNQGDDTLVARKILRSMSEPFMIEGQELYVTASIGISVYPNDGECIEKLIKKADIAMYRAKADGKNNYQTFNRSMNVGFAEVLNMEISLRRAIENGELVPHFQPQVDLTTGAITGVEALVRWQHPELGLIPPAKFLPVAEETGLIVPMDDWMMQAACQQVKTWKELGLANLRVAVNLSARQFRQKDLAHTVFGILEASTLSPENLCLEITETNVMQDVENTIELLKHLKGMGVQLSIDDFGTGYSSLSYLKRFPIDMLKVDRGFVMGIPDDRDDSAITTAIIAMAHSMELKVVAEGLETADQLDFLQRLHCDEMQGFYFSRPLDKENLTELLKTGKRLPALSTPQSN